MFFFWEEYSNDHTVIWLQANIGSKCSRRMEKYNCFESDRFHLLHLVWTCCPGFAFIGLSLILLTLQLVLFMKGHVSPCMVQYHTGWNVWRPWTFQHLRDWLFDLDEDWAFIAKNIVAENALKINMLQTVENKRNCVNKITFFAHNNWQTYIFRLIIRIKKGGFTAVADWRNDWSQNTRTGPWHKVPSASTMYCVKGALQLFEVR